MTWIARARTTREYDNSGALHRLELPIVLAGGQPLAPRRSDPTPTSPTPTLKWHMSFPATNLAVKEKK